MALRIFFYALILYVLDKTNSFSNGWNNIPHTIRMARKMPRMSELAMGRAYAVRVETKTKADHSKMNKHNQFAVRVLNAIRIGGADPSTNAELSRIMVEAREAGVPNEVILRNIEKSDKNQSLDHKYSLFEFYGHGGIGILVHTITDNKNRVAKEMRHAALVHGLRQGESNSVKFKFNIKGMILVDCLVSDDALLEACLEAEVDDYAINQPSPTIESNSDTTCIVVDQASMSTLQKALIRRGYSSSASLMHVPCKGRVAVPPPCLAANTAAIGALAQLRDVQSVDHDMHIPAGG
jgi:transcriptional/translational regulatory protein YebC/TACO1